MKLRKFVREVVQSSHYRRSPSSVLQYAYAKWAFSRFRENNPLKFLEGIGIDTGLATAGFDTWAPKLRRVIHLVQHASEGQGGISLEDGLILYGLARALQPDFIIETGVASGVSTSFFGAGLIENNKGRLFSIELPPKENYRLADGSLYSWQKNGVGWAIPREIRDGLKDRHQMIFADVRHTLPYLVKEIPFIDIFFHDDLHTPDHMLWEYSLVWPHIRSGGVIVSDDSNFGWLQFCRKLRPQMSKSISLRNVDRLTAMRKI